jgi:hypothetical protein
VDSAAGISTSTFKLDDEDGRWRWEELVDEAFFFAVFEAFKGVLRDQDVEQKNEPEQQGHLFGQFSFKALLTL